MYVLCIHDMYVVYYMIFVRLKLYISFDISKYLCLQLLYLYHYLYYHRYYCICIILYCIEGI